jgi:cobaltochelatase CobT
MPAKPSFWTRFIADALKGASRPDGGYAVYTKDYDLEVEATELDHVLGPLTGEEKSAFEAACHEFDQGMSGWRVRFDITCMEAAERIAARMPRERRRETVVTLLIDHSGSMKGQRLLAAAATASAIVDCLCGLDIKVEVLGFTTVSWRGGRAREDWKRRKLDKPGRLCELLHIIYRSADDPHPGIGRGVRQMLRPDLPKENIDGEAIEWALGRLRDRVEPNKVLIVLSDGAPVDDATLHANGPDYLFDHLKAVVSRIEAEGDIAIGAVDICSGHARRVYADVAEAETPLGVGTATLAMIERFVTPRPDPPSVV